MAFKIWCETPEDLKYTLYELHDELDFNISDDFNPTAPVGIIVKLDKITECDRAAFESSAADPVGIMDDYWSDNIETFLEDGGGIWISHEKDLEEFISWIGDDYKILNKPPKAPCGFYLANSETLAWATNTNHAKYWTNFIDGELKTYHAVPCEGTMTTTNADGTQETIHVTEWEVRPCGGAIRLSAEEADRLKNSISTTEDYTVQTQSQAEEPVQTTTTWTASVPKDFVRKFASEPEISITYHPISGDTERMVLAEDVEMTDPMPLSDEELEEIAQRLNKLRSKLEEFHPRQPQAHDDHPSSTECRGAEGIDAVNHPRQAKPHDEEMIDIVNHPNHYANSCSLECFDVMRTVFGDEYTAAGCLFNTFKYLWRYKHKGHPEEDLAKANWYFDRAEDLIPNVEYNDELAEISIRLMHLMEDINNG